MERPDGLVIGLLIVVEKRGAAYSLVEKDLG